MQTFSEFLTEEKTRKVAAATVREYIKNSGIKAKVRMTPGGYNSIQVYTPTFDSKFTSEEIKQFSTYVKSLGMTLVRKTEINPDHEALLTGKDTWEFYL
jgi:hypothetical protein